MACGDIEKMPNVAQILPDLLRAVRDEIRRRVATESSLFSPSSGANELSRA
jgi:hypothetical protein